MLLDPVVGGLGDLLVSASQQVVHLLALLFGEAELPKEYTATFRSRVRIAVPVNKAGEAGNDCDNDQNPDKHFSLLKGCTWDF